MKKLLRLVIIVLVLFVVLVLLGIFAIDLIAQIGLEKGATYALGVETRVHELSLGVFSGHLGIYGMNVANPSGYTSEHLIHSGQFELQMQPQSIFKDTIQLDRFELDGLDVNIEQKIGESNVGEVIDNLNRLGGKKEPGEGKDEKDTEGKKVKVDRIVIRNVVAHFYLLPEVSPGGPVTVEIPEIVLTDVSTGGDGATVAELVRRIFPAILGAIIEKSQGLVSADFLNGLDSQLTELAEALNEQVKQVKEHLDKEVKKIEGMLEGILGDQKKPAD